MTRSELYLFDINTALELLEIHYRIWFELKDSNSEYLRSGALRNKSLGLKIHDRYLNGQRLYGAHWHN